MTVIKNVTCDDLLIQARKTLKILDADEVLNLISGGAKLLDVREPAEFETGHLFGAAHVPRGLLEFMVGEHPALQNVEQNLVVYCKNGGRSSLAANLLQTMGFTNIYMLADGIENWVASGKDVEIPENQYQS